MGMAKKLVWLMVLILGLVFLLGALGALWATPKFDVVNNFPLKQFKLSTLAGAVYLWKAGYWPEINRVKVIYTSEQQKGYILKNGADGQVTQSLWMERKGRTATVYIHYAPEKFLDISNREDWFEADVLAGICLAIEGKSLGYDGCYQKAREHMQWANRNKVGRVVSDSGVNWWRMLRLIRPAYAQSCLGTIVCGAMEWTCGPCPDLANGSPGEDCNSGEACSDSTPCPCSNQCNLGAGQNLQCSSLDNLSLCVNASAADCATGCNNSSDRPCSWWDGIGPTPTPVSGGPGCRCTTSIGACNAEGCGALYRPRYVNCENPCSDSFECVYDELCGEYKFWARIYEFGTNKLIRNTTVWNSPPPPGACLWNGDYCTTIHGIAPYSYLDVNSFRLRVNGSDRDYHNVCHADPPWEAYCQIGPGIEYLRSSRETSVCITEPGWELVEARYSSDEGHAGNETINVWIVI
jgi:hypothetical protein